MYASPVVCGPVPEPSELESDRRCNFARRLKGFSANNNGCEPIGGSTNNLKTLQNYWHKGLQAMLGLSEGDI